MRVQIRLFLAAVFLLSALNACSTHKKKVPDDLRSQLAASEQTQSESKTKFTWKERPKGEVAPGYEVDLASSTDPKLNGRFRVGFDGMVELPYGVKLNAAGLKDSQLKSQIAGAYSRMFQGAPDLQVTISERKYWVDVRGLVNKPGKYLVKGDASLDEVIGAADGLQASAGSDINAAPAARYVRIQQGQDQTLIGLAAYYSGLEQVVPHWQGGEVVFFQSERGKSAALAEGGYVQMLGQVKTPGEYRWVGGDDVFDYVVKAGGPSDRADYSQVDLMRIREGRRTLVSYDLRDPESRLKVPELLPGDVIVVNANNQTATERDVTLWSQVATVVSSVATVIILAITL